MLAKENPQWKSRFLKTFKSLNIFSEILRNHSIDYIPKCNYNTHKYLYVATVTFFTGFAMLPPRVIVHLTKTTKTRYGNPSFQLASIF